MQGLGFFLYFTGLDGREGGRRENIFLLKLFFYLKSL